MRSTFEFQNSYILASSAVCGPMEGKGPLASYFDVIYDDLYVGEKTWEKAEKKMLTDTAELALQKASLSKDDVGFYIAGDLLNQNIAASFSAYKLQLPFIGVYGACSTSMLSLALGAALVNAGYVDNILTAVSSHNCTAEKQFRYPTEYGGQKPNTSQVTVTGAGACIVSKNSCLGLKISYATFGKVIDFGIKNAFEMGQAMAPAAFHTILTHFKDTNRYPKDYDLIVTGDLATIGFEITKEMLEKEGFELDGNFYDCGLMIYDKKQQIFAGGSGCASSALVSYGYLLNQLLNGKYKRVLIVATGALLSLVSLQQGETIPCIAHAVAIEKV